MTPSSGRTPGGRSSTRRLADNKVSLDFDLGRPQIDASHHRREAGRPHGESARTFDLWTLLACRWAEEAEEPEACLRTFSVGTPEEAVVEFEENEGARYAPS